jgi:dTDP-glucose pyrophosphorylase
MESHLYERLKDRIIDKDSSILSALKQMDASGTKLLFVFGGQKFLSIISIGDIQRALIKNIPLETPVHNIMRQQVLMADESEPVESIKETMIAKRIECMPVVNKQGKLVDIYFWEDLFGKEERRVKTDLGLQVVIMAGGKGTRLKPLTNILPKPLMPIGNKTILERIMDRFISVGCSDFFLSVNYKSDLIRYYFKSLGNHGYHLTFLEEDKPLGTAGSLYMLKGKIKKTFIVTNCDILIEQDFSDIYHYHVSERNELTIIAALKHYSIPYGTIESGAGGTLMSLTEKPELTFKINSGMYVLEPGILHEIPDNQHYHITELIKKVKKRGGKIGVFPVSEKSWKDIGDWHEYMKHVK